MTRQTRNNKDIAGSARACLFALLAAFLATFSLVASGHAAPLIIEWKDLLPKVEPLVDPLSHLTPEQAIAVDTVSWARGLPEEERQIDYNQDGLEDAKKYERELAQAGIDVDKLIRDYANWQAEITRREKLVRPDLNGKITRMSGYLLPLEFSEDGETEFLLVPYVGACIHAPAPPANQIVFVRASQSYKVNDLFTPVWVTGEIKTKASSKTLTLVDGSANVSIGYHLADATIQEYKQP